MSKAYDNYNYPQYWKGRKYEHESEKIAIKALLNNVHPVKTALEVGAGFGRITPSYMSHAEQIIFTDPSPKLLKLAKGNLKSKNIFFLQSSLETLPNNLKKESVDLIVMVRVLHHIKNPDQALSIVSNLTKNNGYLILEFANKQHLKANIREFFKGNFTFPLDIFPKDISKLQSKKKMCLPFKNFHPDSLKKCLDKVGFEVVKTRSVSNFRNPLLKKCLPTSLLLLFERACQIAFSRYNFGPSVFILARKVK